MAVENGRTDTGQRSEDQVSLGVDTPLFHPVAMRVSFTDARGTLHTFKKSLL